jgi:hypothetical protein
MRVKKYKNYKKLKFKNNLKKDLNEDKIEGNEVRLECVEFG